MGFCLFEQAKVEDLYIAVNSAHVEDILLQDKVRADGQSVSLLQFSFPVEQHPPLVLGGPDSVRKRLKEAANIGINKVELQSIGGGKKNMKASPLLMNQSDRIVLVREMLPEEFQNENISFLTASEVFLEDGSRRMIVERPAVFVSKVNAGGKLLGL